MSNNTVSVRLALDNTGFVVGANDAGKALAQIGPQARSGSTGVEALSAALGRVAHYGMAAGGLYGLVQTMGAVTTALFEASVTAQRLQVQLNFATGGNAAGELAFVSGVANKLGLELNGAAQAYAGFASAARGTSMEGRKTREVFESIAQASAVMGLSADQTKGALLAVQQMMSKGVVNAEEFRGQLSERMPIALQAAANAMGVTTAEFSKMLETGQVVSADFLPKFAVAIKEMLGDSVDSAANRLDASTARMGNAWDRLKRQVGDAGVSQAVAKTATEMAHYMDGVTDAMDRAKKSGVGLAGELNAGLAQVLARMPFDALSIASNLLNGTINALTGSALGLRTNLNLLPDALQSNAQQAAGLTTKLAVAESNLASLQARLAQVPDNIYLKSETYQAFLLAQQLRAAKREKDALSSGGAGRGSVNPQTVEESGASQARFDSAMEKYASKVEKANKAVDELRKSHGALFTAEWEKKVRDSMDKPPTPHNGTKAAANAQESFLRGLQKERDALILGTAESKLHQAATLGITGAKLTLVEALVRETQAYKDLQKSRLAAEADYQTGQAEEAAALVADSKAREAGRQAINDYAQGIEDQNQATIFELSLMGKTGAERDLAISRYKVEIDLKKQLAAIGANKGFDGEQRAAESTLVRDKAKGAFDGVALQASLDQAKRLGADVPADPFKEWGSTLKASFGSAADGMVQVLAGMSALSASNATYAKEIELINAAKKAGAAPGASDAAKKGATTAAANELALIKQTKMAQLDNYASMAAASKTYFAKHTTAYKLLDGVEKAMHLGKMAMLVVEQGAALSGFATELAAAWGLSGGKIAAAGTAITADVSLTAAGETAKAAAKAPSVIMEFMTWLGPWGAAAAAVAIAAVLGSGGGSPSFSTDAFSAQKANDGTGTVFGDSSAQSKSIENSLSALEGMARPELAFISKMVMLLQDIKDGLQGSTNAIFSSGIDLSGVDFTGTNSSSGGGIMGAIFGKSSSSTAFKDAGLSFAKQTVGQAMAGIDVQKYMTTTTNWSRSGFLGMGSSSGSYDKSTISKIEDDGKLAASLTAVVNKTATAIATAGLQLGATPAQVAAMQAVDSGLGKLTLKDLKPDQVTELLGTVFSAMSDNMALAVMPGLTEFNKTGTGYAETLVKISAATETAKHITDQLGLKEVRLADLRNKLAADTSAELVRQSVMDAETTRTEVAGQSTLIASFFGKGFFGGLMSQATSYFTESLSGIGDIIKNYSGSDAELATLYTSLTDARTALTTMGFSADIVSTQLLKGAGGMDALTQGLADYASGFLGKQEQLALQQAAMDDKFKAIGRTTPATAAEFVALVDGLKAGGAASAYALGQVIVLSGGMKDLTDAAAEAKDALSAVAQALADASQVATDAMSAVQKAIDAQKKIITDSYNATTKPLQASLDVITSSVGKLQGLAGNLKTAMDSMKVSGQDTAQRAQAQAAIHDALVQARAGGALPVNGELTQALQTVAKPSEALYSTYAAYAKDFYRTANEISALSEMTNTQLSGELLSQSLLKDQLAALKTGFDASIAALDLIASGAQAQLDAALGLGVTMGDINKQLGNLHAAIALLAPAKAADAAERGGRINAYVGTLDFSEAGKDVSVAKLYTEATKNGWTQAQLASATGYALPDVAALFSTRGLPSFDVGTNFVPHDMVANIHAGEAIVPRAFNPAAHGRGGTGGDAELIAELRTANALLTATVRELQGLRGATNEVVKSADKTAKTLVRVTRDGEGMVNEPQQDIQKVRVVA